MTMRNDELFSEDDLVYPEEDVIKKINITVNCDRDGQISQDDLKNLEAIKSPTPEHIWWDIRMRNSYGGAYPLPAEYNFVRHFKTARQAAEYAISHPDTPRIIGQWKNVDFSDITWRKITDEDRDIHPVKWEFRCSHPEVSKYGPEEGYNKYLASKGIS